MAESQSIFYGYDTTKNPVEYKEIGRYPTRIGGTIPSPVCDGYSFIQWYPKIDSERKSITSISVSVSKDGTETPYTLQKTTDRAIELVSGEYVAYEMWSSDTTATPSVRIKVSELYSYEVHVSETGTEIFSQTIGNATISESFTKEVSSHTYEVGITSQFVEFSETSQPTVLPDISYYAMYRANTCDVEYGYYDASGAYAVYQTYSVAYGATFTSDLIPSGNPTKAGSSWQGWSPNPNTYVSERTAIKASMYFIGLFKASTLVLNIDGNGATNESERTKSITCEWNAPYPPIAMLPTKEDFTMSGIWLRATKKSDSTYSDICKCYDSNGTSISVVNQVVLSDDNYTCKLIVKWIENSIYDLDGLRDSIDFIPMPFASDPSSHMTIKDGISEQDKFMSFKYGFPSAFSTGLNQDGSGGRVITRQMVNTIGNIGSQCQFYEQCGGYYTYDSDFCASIGGYPKNAFLQYYDSGTAALRTVVSLVDDNKHDFISLGVDGEHWKFVDDYPELSIAVDYSRGIDISSSILIETGVQDLYEVPFDSFFQMFALSYLDCSSLKREDIENVTQAISKDDAGNYVYTTVNGMYYTVGRGLSYLDIYNANTDAFGSVIVGGHFPFEWFVFWAKQSDSWNHAEKICPITPLSCGIMLSKGDKIRLRNSFTDKLPEGNFPETCNADKVVKERLFTDAVMKRKYVVKSAMLYPRGVSL